MDSWNHEANIDHWPAQAASKLSTSLREAAVDGIDLLGVECRKTICRAQIVASDVNRLIEFQQSIVMSADGWRGGTSWRKDETVLDGRLRYTAYFGIEPALE